MPSSLSPNKSQSATSAQLVFVGKFVSFGMIAVGIAMASQMNDLGFLMAFQVGFNQGVITLASVRCNHARFYQV
jgi:hypothetical protein